MTDHNDDNTRTHVVLSSGTMVLHYRIVEKIGAGGMGEVFLAEDTELERKVALKFLPPHLCEDEECRARFRREAQAIAKLSHPNVITIHQVSDFHKRPFFAMELVEGQSLRELAKGRELGIDRIIELAIQICDGLDAAHEEKIVHRDIKPSNIVIDSYGRPKILDFGLAAIQGGEHLTKTGSTLGTVRYMSPEQVMGREVDHRSDLYSLGIVLYEIIAGRTPFERDNEAATLRAIGQDTPEPLRRYKSDIPDELQRIVSKLLEKDPSMRYQTASGVISDLKPLVASTKSSMVVVPLKQKSKWPLAIGGLAVFAVLIVAGLKYWPDSEIEYPSTTSQERIMLAILPFQNLGAKEDEYFADGITDEITSRVAVLEGLGVIARTSILQYKGTKKRIREIGAELNVDYILEGTIRWDKSGTVDKVRITPQLIRVSDETHLWAGNFQRDLSEIFEVQEEIATSIAEALNVTLLTDDQDVLDSRPTENLEAYDHYLRARNYLTRVDSKSGLLKALELFEKAAELDSTFALTFAWKSVAHSRFAFTYELGATEHSRPARLAYERAFEIQTNLGEAHLAQGLYLNLFESDYDGALQEFEIAQKEQVDETLILFEIAIVKMRQGKWDEARKLARQVLRLDPRSINSYWLLIQTLWYTHRFDEALEAIEQAISLAPDAASVHYLKAQLQMSIGADPEQIGKTISEWLSHVTVEDGMSNVEALTFFELFRLGKIPFDVESEISRVSSGLRGDSDPNQYCYLGLLYKLKGEKESSYLYLDSTIILINNRVAKVRRDTTDRYEHFSLDHTIYDLLARAYSQSNRHQLAIEHSLMAMKTQSIDDCHW